MSLVDRSSEALDRVVDHLSSGEDRPGQREMCEAVAAALDDEHHLLVEAGTGTGKSLAYLIPAILSGRRVVVATATKALQDQLLGQDIPFLAEHLDRPFEAAVLKGRANYLCLARLHEASEDGSRDDQLKLVRPSMVHETVPALVDWAQTAESGERSDLPVDVSAILWDALTVSARECPGARQCPHGEGCFAERARDRALEADLVVVNTHLYCLDLAVGGTLLGEHDAAVIDEAHTLEETAAGVFGLALGPGRFSWLADQLKGVLVRDAAEVKALERLSRAFGRALDGRDRRRVDTGEGTLATALTTAGQVVGEALSTIRDLKVPESSHARKLRVLQATDGLAREIEAAAELPDGHVAWVEEGEGISLRVAPVDVGPLLAQHLFADRPVVLTSATLSVGGRIEPTAWNLGLREPAADGSGSRTGTPEDPDGSDPIDDGDHIAGDAGGSDVAGSSALAGTSDLPADGAARGAGEDESGDADTAVSGAGRTWSELQVPSSFDYREQALLYCASHLPDPRDDGFVDAAVEELAGLVEAAGGRTLALFTSYRALRAAADALRDRWEWQVLVQDDAPRSVLLQKLRDDERSCLFATMAFWQGVDIPGDAVRLVTIDKLPFARPDEPLTQARREAAERQGRSGFETVDLARAARLLAQGAGRLIRSRTDRGVVAVLDRRLARARYRRAILDSLPPLRRSIDAEEVRDFLRSLDDRVAA